MDIARFDFRGIRSSTPRSRPRRAVAFQNPPADAMKLVRQVMTANTPLNHDELCDEISGLFHEDDLGEVGFRREATDVKYPFVASHPKTSRAIRSSGPQG